MSMINFSYHSSKEKGLIIHISASKLRLLELADEIGFTKPTRNGMRNFNVGSLDDFVYEGSSDVFEWFSSYKKLFFIDNMTIDDILTPADKQVVIKYALENMKALSDERNIPGHNSCQLYHGQSIIHALLSEELIVNMFSLHDKDFMKR